MSPVCAHTRRDVVQGLALAASSLLIPLPRAAARAPKLPDNPFEMLGVASGDPTAGGVVLWCRLALDLEDDKQWGLSEPAYDVRWEVRALEAEGQPVVQSGTAVASALNAYAVHVEVNGLKPSRRYAYRFMLGSYGDEGVTQTVPAPNDTPEKLRFAFCSCAEYENAFFYAYELMARDEPAFIVHLGDYIYETTYGNYATISDSSFRRKLKPRRRRADCENLTAGHKRVRWLKYDRVGKIRLLSQYRRRYAEHKSDAHLQYAHRHCPFIVTWDDHEVEDDYASDFSEAREETDFVQRRIDAYRAYFENMPIRLSALPIKDSRRQLYRAFDFGRLARLHMLDARQYRADQACPQGLDGGGHIIALADCPDIQKATDESGSPRVMLGQEQLQWLTEQLEASPATWNILAQGLMMAQIDFRADCRLDAPKTEPFVWTDGWSGYAAARQRVIDLMAAHQRKNPVVLGGDVHAHFVNRIVQDWRESGSPAVAPEFICTAISSSLGNWESLRAVGSGNEQTIVDLDCRSHGYVLCDVTKDTFDVTMKRVAPNAFVSPIETAKSEVSLRYRVTAGDPEPRKV